MVKLKTVLAVALAAVVVSADAYLSPRVRGNNAPGRKIGEVSPKEAMRREAAGKMAKASVRKLEISSDANVRGTPVDVAKRIESLCGFDIGLVAKGFNPNVNDNGDIVVTKKLGRPFRGCRQAELVYSKENCALFQIRVFSEPKNMSDDAAKAELQVYADAISRKFGNKVKLGGEKQICFLDGHEAYAIEHPAPGAACTTGQHLALCRDKVKLDNKSAMKKPGMPEEFDWAFSIVLVDDLMRRQPLSAPPPPASAPKARKSDIDAL